MEQLSIDESRSFAERMQSRPRSRWLMDKASEAVTAFRYVWGAEETMPPAPRFTAEADYSEQNRQRWIDEEVRLSELARIDPDKELDVLAYARHRREQADWLTMEIGPGDWPSGILRRGFKGKSAYIGIDNHSYSSYSEGAHAFFMDLREARPGENIFLRSDPTFGRTPDTSLDYYDFPDATADEIYISQVYDKPVNPDCERNADQQAMTSEVARLLKPGGKALIFDYDRNLENIKSWLENAGLELRFVFRSSTTDTETGKAVYDYDKQTDLQGELDCTKGDLIMIAEKPEDWTPAP